MRTFQNEQTNDHIIGKSHPDTEHEKYDLVHHRIFVPDWELNSGPVA